MLVKQEFVNKIRDYFDLNIYETKVWLALLGKGIASAGEVADLSGVPRSRTYDVLESLEKRGFAIVKIGKPVKYLGVKPNVILEKMKNNVKKETEDKIKGLGKIRETDEFTKLEELYKEGVNPIRREDISAALKGKSNISNHLKDIISEAKKEVIICTDVEDLAMRPKLFRQTFEILKDSKVKLKISLSGDENLIKKIEKDFGMKFARAKINSKFFIIDRKEILFYISKDQDGDDIAIWLNSEFFSEAFASMFESSL